MHLITGANGQIGSALTKALIQRYGYDNVLLTDIRPTTLEGNFTILNVLDTDQINEIFTSNKITHIYHLAAILSAKGEDNPLISWKVNMDGLLNMLEAARTHKVDKVFFPSSIAAFGSDIDLTTVDQNALRNPKTVYGISKVAGENWAKYYFEKYDVDVRSVRFPGVIGWEAMPGGGTTDYAVEIFHEALKTNQYECFLKADEELPMIYMDDTLKAIIQLMEAPKENITVRTSYNLQGCSFTPKEIADLISKEIPTFAMTYKPDFRQGIAQYWPDKLDDSRAKQDWNWNPDFNLEKMTKDMFFHLRKQYQKSTSK